ncbi:hypothetical protein HHO41_21470 [Bacillus sp. DNRA2]|nr:hypothetical protein [Bacillus sp. DNRA2]NMD72795.1 hypothetical protein [Bacillus sp. DNRA2]
MELMNLQIVLLVATAMIGMVLNVMGTVAYHGVKIFLLIRKETKRG